MDFISELVASTDDEDFAVLLADVECLPDEVLETLAAVLQSCAGRGWIAATMNLDRHALERLGHYIVSRRVALGYRNRTDLADSLQFTVRTRADIEHGVRKASPGTYAMLETSWPGHAAASNIWPEESPTSWCPHCTGATPTPRPRDTRCARPTPTPYRRCPPRSCCWSCDGASSPPETDATTPGATGTAAA